MILEDGNSENPEKKACRMAEYVSRERMVR